MLNEEVLVNCLSVKEVRKFYYFNNREKYLKKQKLYMLNGGKEIRDNTLKNLKKEVFLHYGNECICCKENRFEFLTIDHINNNGAKHRKEYKTGTGKNVCRWLKKNNYPKSFQLLCYNCNCSKGFFGYCPHEKRDSLNA